MASIAEGGKVPNVRVSNWILIVDVPPIRAIKYKIKMGTPQSRTYKSLGRGERAGEIHVRELHWLRCLRYRERDHSGTGKEVKQEMVPPHP